MSCSLTLGASTVVVVLTFPFFNLCKVDFIIETIAQFALGGAQCTDQIYWQSGLMVVELRLSVCS